MFCVRKFFGKVVIGVKQVFNKSVSYLAAFAAFAVSLFVGGDAHATDPTIVVPSIGVDAGEVMSSISTTIGPWLVAGAGIAISLMAFYLGWRWFRRLAR